MRRPSTRNKQEAKMGAAWHLFALGWAEHTDGWAALFFTFLRKLYKQVNAQRSDSTHFFRIPTSKIENLGLRIEELPKESEGLYNPPPTQELQRWWRKRLWTSCRKRATGTFSLRNSTSSARILCNLTHNEKTARRRFHSQRSGWASRIRTYITGTKNQGPAIGRWPSVCALWALANYSVFTKFWPNGRTFRQSAITPPCSRCLQPADGSEALALIRPLTSPPRLLTALTPTGLPRHVPSRIPLDAGG